MKFIANILTFMPLLLFSTVSTLQAQEIVGGMTIFNTDNFYSQDDALMVHSGFTVILDKTETKPVIAIFNKPKYESNDSQIADNKKTEKSKVNKKQAILIVSKPKKIKDKNQPQFKPWGNAPFSNNSYYTNAFKNLGVVPSNTLNKYTKYTHALINSSQESVCVSNFTTVEQKQAFPTHESAFVSSNYSKTSRIRPPPFC